MSTRFRSHADRIRDHALATVFPLPDRPDPARVEGVLTGYVLALEAIGAPIKAQVAEVEAELAHRTAPAPGFSSQAGLAALRNTKGGYVR